MADQIQLRRDTAANWTAANPILAQGEPGYETDTKKMKYGDGTTNWNTLSYASGGASVEDSPSDGNTGDGISSNWAYDHETDTRTSKHLSSGEKTAAIRDATSSQNGLMSSTYAGKLDNVADNANDYTHPTSDVNHLTDAEKTALGDNSTHRQDSTIHLTSTQKTNLTGGLNSADHYHSSDRDRSNHAGTQLHSTISDFDAEVDARITLQKAAANGIATLGADSKILTSQLPAITLIDTYVEATEVAQLALTVQRGDICIRSDLSKSFVALNDTNGSMSDWQEFLTPTDTVLSVDGQTAIVDLSNVYEAKNSNIQTHVIQTSSNPHAVAHSDLTDKGANTHIQIDSHITNFVSNAVGAMGTKDDGNPLYHDKFVHPSENHIPSDGSLSQILEWDSAGKAKWVDPTGGVDADAIHDNVAAEISTIAEKTSLVGADLIIIEDSENGNAKKRVQITNLPGGADSDAIHITQSGEISTITEKASPVDADLIVIEDSQATNAKKRVQLSNLPGVLTSSQETEATREATSSQNGLMSSTFAGKLDNIETNAKDDQNASEVSIADAGAFFTTDNVEFALQKVATDIQALTGADVYMGVHDCSGGVYPLSPQSGQYWKCSVAGTISTVPYAINDHLIYNGSTWDKIDNTNDELAVHEAATATHGVGEIVGRTESQTLTNKGIDSTQNTITNIANADIKSDAAIAESKLALSYATHDNSNDHSNSLDHSHSNKSTLDNVTAAYTTAEESKLAGITDDAIAELIEDTTPQLGGDLDLNGHSIKIAASLADGEASGLEDIGYFAASLSAFIPLYVDSSGYFNAANASDDTKICVALTLEAASGANKKLLWRGKARNDSWTWTAGGMLFLSTSGDLTQTKPSTVGQIVQVVGVALSATMVMFNPSFHWIKLK